VRAERSVAESAALTPSPKPQDGFSLVLRVEGLSFAYPQGKTVLDQLHFHISKGERVGLVGPNGAGKTTLFLCLAGVLNVPAGVIHLAGLDPALAADRRELPGRIGIVFQNSDDQLFSTTLADDVAFGPLNLGMAPAEARQRVAESLQRVGLEGMEQRAPFHLSGGEKRRAALAGVLAMRPGVLLLDEPSMFLDPRGRRELIGLLKELPGTQIIASHDLDMILDCCTRVLLLDAGRLIADGPAVEVLKDRQLMEQHGLEVPFRLLSKT
jgi:cobalt/nickel transport system ATP-binding protein